MAEFAVPIMPANDLDATLSFYERLGFENTDGMRELALVDPSGNLVRVGSPPFA